MTPGPAILAIDPGPVQSAWLIWTPIPGGLGGGIGPFAITPNEELIQMLRGERRTHPERVVVIEKIESYGMTVGAEVFATVHWSGRFTEACNPMTVIQLGRMAVKMHLCHSSRAKDPNIRQALIDRFGGDAAIGTTKSRGPLYGVSKDVWSALAIAVTWADTRGAA